MFIDNSSHKFPVTINYAEQTITSLLVDGRYDEVSPKIADDPQNTKHGIENLRIELVHFGTLMPIGSPYRELSGMGFRPATTIEVLALGAQFCNIQRQYPIISLGDILTDEKGVPYVLILRVARGKRIAGLCQLLGWWDECCRFAAIAI